MSEQPVPAEVLITDEHHLQLSRIVTGYARAEMALKSTVARMLGMQVSLVMILTAPYTAQNLRNVAKVTGRMIFLKDDPAYLELCQIIGLHKKHGKLRNDIGHNLWIWGSRQNSPRPAYVDVRNERPDFMGFEDEEIDYTLADLKRAADEVSTITRRLGQLVNGSHFKERTAAAIAIINSPTDTSEGIS